jgi:hypothetical protein
MASQSSSDKTVTTGFLGPHSAWGEYNQIIFAVHQALAQMQTNTLVKVVSCTNNGGLSPVGFVDVLPLVNQIDPEGKAEPHTTIHNVPYLRIQGGANAVIIDPEPGDIGICAFASRDISRVKATKDQANPGSFRKYSFADGMYMGGVLNGTPSQYVQFNSAGIRIHSPTQIKMDAPDIRLEAQTIEMVASTSITATAPTFTINAATYINGLLSQGQGSAGGTATMQGPVTIINDLTAQGTSVHTHVHSGVQTGSGNTGGPV